MWKWFCPVHESFIFSYFFFKIFYVFFPMISYPLIRQWQKALSISWMFVFNVGRWERILYFLRNLWNNENLVFPAFSDSLFAENHTLILINWSLTLIMMWLCYRSQKNIVCEHYWSKNIWRIREMVYINKNNDSPSNEPCGTPHLISFFTVLEDSVTFIYFFLPFK